MITSTHHRKERWFNVQPPLGEVMVKWNNVITILFVIIYMSCLLTLSARAALRDRLVLVLLRPFVSHYYNKSAESLHILMYLCFYNINGYDGCCI